MLSAWQLPSVQQVVKQNFGTCDPSTTDAVHFHREENLT